MLAHARENELDVVYGKFRRRHHPATRILGSWAVNALAVHLLNKPRGLYLSSFKVINRFVIDEICKYHGPAPYVDGLALRATDRIAQIDVEHHERTAGVSGYTFAKLLALWLNIVVEYSVRPFRLVIAGGILLTLLGIAGFCVWGTLALVRPEILSAYAWVFPLAALAFGFQIFTMGFIGEFVGRVMLHKSGMPQQVIRSVHLAGPAKSAVHESSAGAPMAYTGIHE
jgi:undecaprenyl-phosphate 4-deoxy-4-formamido-L-arabinose transferase